MTTTIQCRRVFNIRYQMRQTHMTSPPTRAIVCDAIEGLLEGRYSREQVAAWQHSIYEHFG